METSSLTGALKQGNGFLETSVRIPAAALQLRGTLRVPACAEAMVLFAHGSGSSRLSPRNNYVAKVLREAGVATLLFDLLTEDEEQDGGTLFNITLLAERLRYGTAFVREHPQTKHLRIGYFGASTGAAAALLAAASDARIGAMVARGGRVDLAADALPRMQAPTLLIVGGKDTAIIRLNEQVYERLTGVRQLAIVAGASHLFEETGALKEVARLASQWFVRHLTTRA